MMDLILHNANVITMDPALTRTDSVTVKNGRVLAVGEKVKRRESGAGRVIDCKGKTVIPGFIDAHCHLTAYAEKLMSLDLSPQAGIHSLSLLKDAIRSFSENQPDGTWIRGKGYDEFRLREKRHPNRHDLDKVAPYHPVKLTHRSGHAHVLNSVGLKLVGISSRSGDPPDGLIDRDLETGEPTGILFGMGNYLAKKIPAFGENETREGIRHVNEELLSFGITSIHDATSHNDFESWNALKKWRGEGLFKPAVAMMLGTQSLGRHNRNSHISWANDNGVKARGVKIVVHEVTGDLSPSQERLNRMVLDIHQAGLQAALHCVEENTIIAACNAIEHALQHNPKDDHRHRLEHCSVCPPELVRRIALLGITVVTQPAFLYYSGDRYLETVPAEQLKNLYPIGSLLQNRIHVAAGSDFPITSPNPFIGIAAAAVRKSERGKLVLREQAISPADALRMYTLGAAEACFEEKEKGSITVGKRADLAVLSADPLSVGPHELQSITVDMTIIDGQIVWKRK
ncbi:MAG TPA: amidohydrolase [Syntrophorhabdaceae bacterium]|nr:amidohydrolase [Syntrophorhabdaceae bacterium]